jgi:hypothetical protein
VRFTGVYPLSLISPPHDCASFEVAALWHGSLGARADLTWFRTLLREVASALDAVPVRRKPAKPRRAARKAA